MFEITRVDCTCYLVELQKMAAEDSSSLNNQSELLGHFRESSDSRNWQSGVPTA